MFLERKQDLSVYYWLVNLFSDAPFINIEDGYPETDFVIPTVAVEWSNISLFPLEMGNKKGFQRRMWFIEIFAETKSQRDDISYRILNAIEDNIPVNDYDEGFPPNISPTQLGCLIPQSIKVEIIRVIPELVDKLYWRAVVSFTAEYTQI